MYVRRDAMVHVECSRLEGVGGALCVSIEESDGQFSLPRVLEIGPFDTGLDAVVWLRNVLVSDGVLSK